MPANARDLKKQLAVVNLLRWLNNPSVKSIQSPDGEIIDCVNIAQQPAFDHPSLNNHTIQLRPGFRPEILYDETKIASDSGSNRPNTIAQLWHQSGRSPEGTIPIRRTRRTRRNDVLRASSVKRYGRKRQMSIPRRLFADPGFINEGGHQHANSYVNGERFCGAKAIINVWEPNIQLPNEFSLSQLWILEGSFGQDLNSIEAGWLVSPELYGDTNTRMFSYWTSDSYQATGCYNFLCSGFIQISGEMAMGASIYSLSQYDGSQYDISILVWKDGTYNSVFFYASWRPFSQTFRSTFDTLSSMFRQIRHLVLEEYSAMPRTTSIRYHGLKYLDSSVGFYRELKGENLRNEKTVKKMRRESDISLLPPELLEKILLKALAASRTPIEDILYFRKTCKYFYVICLSKNIGKHMNVEDWSMYRKDKQNYVGFLQNCANSENMNALFLLGLEEMFNGGNYNAGLHYLQLSSIQGHAISKYVLGLWWFREDSSRSQGILLLKEVSNNIYQCRRLALQIFDKMIRKKWPSLSFFRCKDLSCGTPISERDNRWLYAEEMKRWFCSNVCQWSHECKYFSNWW